LIALIRIRRFGLVEALDGPDARRAVRAAATVAILFLYWLPGCEPLLWPGDDASEAEKQAWRDRVAEHYRSVREQTASG
jgi:hypothetical protein